MQVQRAEDWAYTARSLDASGVVRLTGELLGFGASVQVAGKDLPEERVEGAREAERAGILDAVTLDLRLTGRVVECSQPDFAAALPHRALAIHFPPEPMGTGASWPDGGLLRAFEGAIPLAAEVRTEATTLLGKVDPHGDGWQAYLTHTARLQVGDGGPALEIAGSSTWDTQPGALATRQLEARWRPDAPAGTRGAVGVLRIELVRLDDVSPRDG